MFRTKEWFGFLSRKAVKYLISATMGSLNYLTLVITTIAENRCCKKLRGYYVKEITSAAASTVKHIIFEF